MIGTLPGELSALKELQVLSLEKGALSGSIPSSFGSLSNLQKLDLDYNALTGPIPLSLSNAKNISVLDLNGNRLTGGIEALANLPLLVFAQLHSNDFSGTIPQSLGNLELLRKCSKQKLFVTDSTFPQGVNFSDHTPLST